MNKTLTTILSIVIASATTATLDWAFAKVTETQVNVPIVTPFGVTDHPVVVKEKRGRFSGHKYK